MGAFPKKEKKVEREKKKERRYGVREGWGVHVVLVL